jgi:hypothetical protein
MAIFAVGLRHCLTNYLFKCLIVAVKYCYVFWLKNFVCDWLKRATCQSKQTVLLTSKPVNNL